MCPEMWHKIKDLDRMNQTYHLLLRSIDDFGKQIVNYLGEVVKSEQPPLKYLPPLWHCGFSRHQGWSMSNYPVYHMTMAGRFFSHLKLRGVPSASFVHFFQVFKTSVFDPQVNSIISWDLLYQRQFCFNPFENSMS